MTLTEECVKLLSEDYPDIPKDLELFKRYETTFRLFDVAFTKFKTAEDLMAAVPDLLKALPGYDAKVLQAVWPDLVAAAYHPKNRNIIHYASKAQVKYWGDIVLKGILDGKKICWFYYPQEPDLYYALDYVPICTEVPLLSSVLWVEGAEDAIDACEAKDFGYFMCSAGKIFLGYLLLGNIRPGHALPKNSIPCAPTDMTHQAAARWFNMPIIPIDSPYYLDKRGFDYALRQTKEYVLPELERIAGQELDENKFRKIEENANRTYELLNEIHELKKNKPMPVPGLTRIVDFLMVDTMLGLPECTEYFKIVRDEAKERVKKGEGVIPPDKEEIRVMYTYGWIAYYPTIYHWAEENYGATYLACCLTYWFDGISDLSTKDSMIEGWVQRMMNFPMAHQSYGPTDVWVDDFVRWSSPEVFDADCNVWTGHIGCKQGWAASKLMADKLAEEYGIPSIRIDMDLCDKRLCPPDELKSRLGSFFEMVAARKKVKKK